MTFILTIKTTEGIVLAADSREVVQGGYLKWEDFAGLLQSKGQNEDSEDICLSPKEIAELIYERSRKTDGRIMGYDGAKKIFRITANTAILIAGKANPGGRDFALTLEEIQFRLSQITDPTYEQIVDTSFEVIKMAFSNDGEDKYDSEHIVCGYDQINGIYRNTKFQFQDALARDERGQPITSEGRLVYDKVFSKMHNDQVLNTGGMTKCIGEIRELNLKAPSFNLQQGYILCRKILDLAVSIENFTEQIPAIGGHLYYAVITPTSFTWVGQDNAILNIIPN